MSQKTYSKNNYLDVLMLLLHGEKVTHVDKINIKTRAYLPPKDFLETIQHNGFDGLAGYGFLRLGRI